MASFQDERQRTRLAGDVAAFFCGSRLQQVFGNFLMWACCSLLMRSAHLSQPLMRLA